MLLIDKIAEKRIEEARDKGELENLPGEGKPLTLEDESHIPPELRVGYRLLKNAGFIPAEVTLRKEISEVQSLLRMTHEPQLRTQLSSKLNLLLAKLGQSRKTPTSFLVESEYALQMRKKFQKTTK